MLMPHVVSVVNLLDDELVDVDKFDVLVIDVVVVHDVVIMKDVVVVNLTTTADEVVVVADVDELLMTKGDVHKVDVDQLDDVMAKLPPVDVMLDVKVVVDEVEDEDDAMRPAGSIFRCTRMCDA